MIAAPKQGRPIPAVLGGSVVIGSILVWSWFVAATGCSLDALPPVSHDLGRLLPYAEVERDTTRVDFGTDAAAPLLLDGWSTPERSPRHAFVWGVGERSALQIFVAEPGPRTLVGRCWPLSFARAPDQTVTVRVNGKQVATTRLEPIVADYRWEIPAELLDVGPNRIEFEYAYHRKPVEVLPGAADERDLAVAWVELQVLGGSPDSASQILFPDGTVGVRLPFSRRVHYYVRVSEPAYLSLGPLLLAPQGADPESTLHVRVEGDRSGPILERAFEPAETLQMVRLPLSGEDVIRVSLTAVPGSDAAAGGIEIRELVLRSPGDPAPQRPRGFRSGGFVARPNVLLYTVDALRADHLSAYGYSRPTAPRLEEFAADAVLFDDARAASAWTRPTVASILTGLHPWRHGANGRLDKLSEDVVTLAERLRDEGYETAGIITNGNVARVFGLGQGFDTYLHLKEDLERPGVHHDADALNEQARKWLRERPTDRPFFLYLHASDPHGPYSPAPEFQARFADGVADPRLSTYQFIQKLNTFKVEVTEDLRRQLSGLYDAEIAFVDREFGRLMDLLRQLDAYDDTLVVFVSDHGEEFYEHGWWEHGKTLYDEQLRIPLIIKFPASWAAGHRVPEAVDQVDVAPTILAYLGLDHADCDGMDLAALLEAGTGETSRPIAAALELDGRVLDSLLVRDWKLIEYRSYFHPNGKQPRSQLYELRSDPGEQHDRIAERPILAGFLRAELAAYRARIDDGYRAEQAAIDDDMRENLRALGYLP